MRKVGIALFLFSNLFGLSACYDDVNTTLHEPGEYKGPVDPLLAQMKTPELQEQLDQRFRTVQGDR